MIKARILMQSGKVFDHHFETKNVQTVWRACAKTMGKSFKNTIENNKIVWNFENGKVVIEGEHHFGNRQDTAKQASERRKARRNK